MVTMRRSPSFATRLEGTLNQIRLQCLGRVTDLEVQQHHKDHLFNGVHKHIQDFIRYLYSTPETSYSQLMVAACKVGSKNEEVQEKLRARAAVTTGLGEDTIELGHQTAKLMSTLCPASAPNSPRQKGHGRGWTNRGNPANPAPIMAGPVLDRLTQATAHLLGVGQELQ